MSLKTVTFKEKELVKEGFKNGRMWTKYSYLGDDGDHYTLFGNHDLETPYQLAQKQREFQGKVYTDWFIVPEGKGAPAETAPKAPGEGVKSILAKLEEVLGAVGECRRILDQFETRAQKKIDSELPF